jgi:hypothetical protein
MFAVPVVSSSGMGHRICRIAFSDTEEGQENQNALQSNWIHRLLASAVFVFGENIKTMR